jgi:hypothetical protein
VASSCLDVIIDLNDDMAGERGFVHDRVGRGGGQSWMIGSIEGVGVHFPYLLTCQVQNPGRQACQATASAD